MMVAVVSGAQSSKSSPETQQNPRRPPLLPSERENNGVGPKRPKSRQVSSRYMSPSPSTSTSSSISSSSSTPRRYPSPIVSRTTTPLTNTPASVTKRSVSADRRRPPSRPDLASKLRNAAEVSAATKLLVTSTRSFSVSFQGETFTLPVSKTKASPATPNLSYTRKGTPERRRSSTPVRGKVDGCGDQVEYSKPTDQLRWPARIRQPNPLARSFDCSEENTEKVFGSGDVIRALQNSMTDESRRASFGGSLSLDLSNAEAPKGTCHCPDGNSVNGSSVSDSDSISSGSSTSGAQDCGGNGISRRQSGPRGIAVSAKFWQETNNRLRKLQDPGSPISTSPAKLMTPPKFAQLRKVSSENHVSSPRTMASPVRGSIRPASPCKLMEPMRSSPSRAMSSPSRVRSSVAEIISSSNESPSVLSFAVDVRRGKVGENRIVDAHLLRLLYNRQLQWRFVNARTEAGLLVQKHGAEKNMWNAWITISDLRDSVTKKRHRLQLLRQKLKLASILKGQTAYLEAWASLDNDHSASLLGANEALTASTLRLPVAGGVIADVQGVKDAIGSAVHVMQAMASSICPLSAKVEEMNSLVMELGRALTKETTLIEQCNHFLSMSATMQVKHSSLRTHILQLSRIPTS